MDFKIIAKDTTIGVCADQFFFSLNWSSSLSVLQKGREPSEILVKPNRWSVSVSRFLFAAASKQAP